MSSISSIDRDRVEQLVRQAVERLAMHSAASPQVAPAQAPSPASSGAPKLLVSISARHVHLTDEHVEKLFGPGRKLTPGKPLYQDGFYAAEETVMIVGPRRRMLPRHRQRHRQDLRDPRRHHQRHRHRPRPFAFPHIGGVREPVGRGQRRRREPLERGGNPFHLAAACHLSPPALRRAGRRADRLRRSRPP